MCKGTAPTGIKLPRTKETKKNKKKKIKSNRTAGSSIVVYSLG